MRERIEDLGRLMVLLDEVCDSAIFKHCEFDIPPRFDSEEYEDVWKYVCSQIKFIEYRLHECLEIATGQDYLNS